MLVLVVALYEHHRHRSSQFPDLTDHGRAVRSLVHQITNEHYRVVYCGLDLGQQLDQLVGATVYVANKYGAVLRHIYIRKPGASMNPPRAKKEAKG